MINLASLMFFFFFQLCIHTYTRTLYMCRCNFFKKIKKIYAYTFAFELMYMRKNNLSLIRAYFITVLLNTIRKKRSCYINLLPFFQLD